MNCLCCGKPLEPNTEHGWHAGCIKKFFGTTKLPLIELDEESLSVLVEKSTDKGFTVPGVQKKLSLHLHSGRGQQPRFTLVDYPTGYILKHSRRFPSPNILLCKWRSGFASKPFRMRS